MAHLLAVQIAKSEVATEGAVRRTLTTFHQSLGAIQYDHRMVLAQTAHKRQGTQTISKSGAPPGLGGDYSQGFVLEGSTWEGFVTLNMRSDDRRSLSFATSLLPVTNRGKSLVGHLVYRSSEADRVCAEDVHWTRA